MLQLFRYLISLFTSKKNQKQKRKPIKHQPRQKNPFPISMPHLVLGSFQAFLPLHRPPAQSLLPVSQPAGLHETCRLKPGLPTTPPIRTPPCPILQLLQMHQHLLKGSTSSDSVLRHEGVFSRVLGGCAVGKGGGGGRRPSQNQYVGNLRVPPRVLTVGYRTLCGKHVRINSVTTRSTAASVSIPIISQFVLTAKEEGGGKTPLISIAENASLPVLRENLKQSFFFV